jgi:uncharacterized protein
VGVAGTFIRGGAGNILVVTHEPAASPRRSVLVVPAFGEEMNKSRRLVADVGSALAAKGIRTIVPDLYGTGDSEGEFADAAWDIWVEDLACTARWDLSRGTERIDVLLVRLGAALFADARERLPAAGFARGVAWQPVNGSDTLKQLLRMKSMAVRMAGGRAAPADEALRAALAGPAPTELGGYLISPALASAMHAASFAPSGGRATVERGLALELDPSIEAETVVDASPWSTRRIAAERFWLAVEPKTNPNLAAMTAEYLAA